MLLLLSIFSGSKIKFLTIIGLTSNTRLISWLAILIFGLPFLSTSQVGRNGSPVSWSLENEIDVSVSFLELDEVDYESLMFEDETVALEKEAPSRFAYGHTVFLNPDNSGRWVTLDNGDRVWMLGIQGSSAQSMGVTFGELSLPRGSKLFIYSQDREDVIGALTDMHNTPSGIMTTRPVNGSEIVIEYYEPLGVRGLGEIQIRTIAEGYRDGQTEMRDFSDLGMCHRNINCLEHREMQDRTDATVLVLVDDGTRWMSGTLLNNTAKDERPLLMTKQGDFSGDPSSWVFVFDYKSKLCSPSIGGVYSKTLSGATLLATHESSATSLVELYSEPPGSWNIFFAGWSRRDLVPSMAYSMHHPEGDVMKYAVSQNIQVQSDGFLPTWQVNWDEGTTEKGAVGCALFDQNGLVVGSFEYGDYTCQNSAAYDSYTRFSAIWSTFRDYLDPTEGGQTSLLGKFGGIEPSDSDIIEGNIAVFPNPASDFLTVYNGNTEEITGVNFYDINGRLCQTSIPNYQKVDVSQLPTGIYLVEIKLDTMVQIRKVVVN